MAAWTLSPRAKMVFRRHVPPAHVPVLKNSAFDLMTRSAFVAQVPAEPKQSTTHRDARRIAKPVRPLRSAVRPKTATTPTSGPGHKLSTIPGTTQAVAKHGKGCLGDVYGGQADHVERISAVRAQPSCSGRQRDFRGRKSNRQLCPQLRDNAAQHSASPLSTAAGICTVAGVGPWGRAASRSALRCAERSRVGVPVGPRRQAGLFGRAPPIARRPAS